MNKEYSAFQILRNNDNKIKAQKLVVEDNWKILKVKYNGNYHYYNYHFNLAASEIFEISNFESLLVVTNYQIIWSNFNIQNNLDDNLLGALEFFFNIFYTATSLAWKYYQKKWYASESERKNEFWRNFKVFQDFLAELKKFFDWSGYTLIKYDNQINKGSEHKEYHLVKKDIVKMIESINVVDDLKTLLLELSQESLERKDLENYLSIIYNNFLANEQDEIKKYLGSKFHSNIFNLFNNGLIKHKDSKNINKLSQFNEDEKLNALKWLRDMVLVYFAVSRNGNYYPEKIINSKFQNNAN